MTSSHPHVISGTRPSCPPPFVHWHAYWRPRRAPVSGFHRQVSLATEQALYSGDLALVRQRYDDMKKHTLVHFYDPSLGMVSKPAGTMGAYGNFDIVLSVWNIFGWFELLPRVFVPQTSERCSSPNTLNP